MQRIKVGVIGAGGVAQQPRPRARVGELVGELADRAALPEGGKEAHREITSAAAGRSVALDAADRIVTGAGTGAATVRP